MTEQIPISKRTPIIDLFSGPGGLGEGFSSVLNDKEERVFKIALSIECDEHAHQTLALRAFTRQFLYGQIPEEYYQFLRGEITLDKLYHIFPAQSKQAHKEAWKFKLGDSDTYPLIDSKIKTALKGEKNFVLIGGPPCQAYSLVGRARRKEIGGLNKDDERVYLYREYYRILAEHRPAVFVMENVKGILSSKVEEESIFKQIIEDLRDPIKAYNKLQEKQKFYKSKIGYKIYSLTYPVTNLFEDYPSYNPKEFVIKSEKYGIPQTRHRVILVGVRSDLNIIPQLLAKHDFSVPVENVLNGLPRLRSGLSKDKDGDAEWVTALHEMKNEDFKADIPDDIWKKMETVIDEIVAPSKGKGSLFVQSDVNVDYLPEWYLDDKIKGAVNHESRTHIKLDLYRYLFASCFAMVKGRSPKLFEFPPALLPNHLNASHGKFTDRFRVQSYGSPSKTVTSHISKDGHYFIHPDASQCRSLTVREAARIQTFSDNYYFCGPRTQQFHQVGNAVPPLLAKQIGEVVLNLFRSGHYY